MPMDDQPLYSQHTSHKFSTLSYRPISIYYMIDRPHKWFTWQQGILVKNTLFAASHPVTLRQMISNGVTYIAAQVHAHIPAVYTTSYNCYKQIATQYVTSSIIIIQCHGVHFTCVTAYISAEIIRYATRVVSYIGSYIYYIVAKSQSTLRPRQIG